MSIILQRCRRTGALAEDCGGNYACDNSCDLEEIEVIPIEHLLKDETLMAVAKILHTFGCVDGCQDPPTGWLPNARIVMENAVIAAQGGHVPDAIALAKQDRSEDR